MLDMFRGKYRAYSNWMDVSQRQWQTCLTCLVQLHTKTRIWLRSFKLTCLTCAFNSCAWLTCYGDMLLFDTYAMHGILVALVGAAAASAHTVLVATVALLLADMRHQLALGPHKERAVVLIFESIARVCLFASFVDCNFSMVDTCCAQAWSLVVPACGNKSSS